MFVLGKIPEQESFPGNLQYNHLVKMEREVPYSSLTNFMEKFEAFVIVGPFQGGIKYGR